MTRLEFITEMLAYVEQTNSRYSELFRRNVETYPIPYFGCPSRAVIATIGVNPSATEFERNRWPKQRLTHQELLARLCRYFKDPPDPAAPPHRWFKSWSCCLSILGHSYEKDAIHLDLSPRATKAMGDLDSLESHKFREMVRDDLYLFFAALKQCPKLKAGLMAGSVTKQFYMNEFLCKFAHSHCYLLQRAKEDFGLAERNATTLYDLVEVKSGRVIKLFFYRSGPSFRNGAFLIEEVQRLGDTLKKLGF